MKREITLTINGQHYELSVPDTKLLVDLLREDLGLTGTKVGCGAGECGVCTVLLNGMAVYSCLIPAVAIDGSEVMTIEGLVQGDKLHPLQEAFINHGAAQCGYCTPGMILSAKALLDKNPNPSGDEIKKALAGNFCRCTGYAAIFRAVKSAAEGAENG